MVLCAKSEDGSKIEFLEVSEGTEIGELISIDGQGAANPDDVISSGKKGKPSPWEEVLPALRTNDDKVATFDGHIFRTSAGVVTCASLASSPLN